MMNDNLNKISPPKIYIYSSELKTIVHHTSVSGAFETGGFIIGKISKTGEIIISLAVNPGPKATHRVAHFCPDLDYFRSVYYKVTSLFNDHDLLGNYHKHPGEDLDHPSNGDINHVKAVSGVMNIDRMAVIIITKSDDNSKKRFPDQTYLSNNAPGLKNHYCYQKLKQIRWLGKLNRQNKKISADGNIILNPFMFEDSRSGEFRRCDLNVLPGMSPVRQALIDKGILKPQKKLLSYAPSHITIKGANNLNQNKNLQSFSDSSLMKQCRKLPDKIYKKVLINKSDDKVILTIPVPDKAKAYLIINKYTHAVERIYFNSAGEHKCKDLTNSVLSTSNPKDLPFIFNKLLNPKKSATKKQPRKKTRGEKSC